MRCNICLALAVVFTLAGAASREASAQESVAMSANRRFKLGIGPTLLLPEYSGGPYGGGLNIEGRYGLQVGPTVVAPGGMIAGYYMPGRFIGLAMPTLRLTLPVGPLAPFVVGGVGVGRISNPSDGGLALLYGGGLMIHFAQVFAIGAEGTYQTIQGTDFGVVAIGPAISIGR